MDIKKIAILFSGNGSNLEVLLEKLHNKIFDNVKFEVVLTICNKENANGIIRSRKYKIEPVIVNHKNYANREEFDLKLVEEIRKANIDLTVLAGFMRILSPIFTKSVKAINLHPSILPLFKGANAIKESYESDMTLGGVSVHWVSEELDGGKIIAQEAFQKNNMKFDEFKEKIHKIEHEILPNSVIKILKNSRV